MSAANILTRALIWVIIGVPKKLTVLTFRLLKFINGQFDFILNIRLLFTPLFGDFTFIGRVIGVITRLVFIVFGLIFVGALFVVSLFIPILWFYLPFLSIKFLGLFITILIYSGLTALRYFALLNEPEKRIPSIKNEKYLDAFRPECYAAYHLLQQDYIAGINTIFKNPKVQKVFYIAELQINDMLQKLTEIKTLNTRELEKIIFDFATQNKSRFVEIEHLLLSIISLVPNTDIFLAGFGIKFESLKQTAFWMVNKREEKSKVYFWQEDYEMPKSAGVGHGMTGRVTPDLDAISEDFTEMAKMGLFKKIVGRDKETEQIAELLGGKNINVLLMGEPGSGKTTIVKGIAHKIAFGVEYKTLANKRIVSIELGGLLAGAKSSGDIAKKVEKAFTEIRKSRDIIVFIDEIHTLAAGVGSDMKGASSIFAMLEPYLSAGDIQFIGATNIANYRKFIEPNGSFARLFQTIEVPPASDEDSIKILQSICPEYESEFNITVTYPALEKIIKLSDKLIHERVLPDKAIDILNRASVDVAKTTRYLTAKEIERVVAEFTHIPVSAVSEDESQKLLTLEQEMQKKVIGQNHAVTQIVGALKRARLGIRDQNKPIASFLFVGTTGVGKTETAKTLSELYFGGKTQMIRIDMSEYQTPDSIDKLIGTSDGETTGILTDQVRTKPFALVLLDEIEKANSEILLTFLQVLDDGRLTDSSGRVIDFTNTIIIATSNAGTREIQEVFERKGSFDEMQNAAMGKVREKFAPEFLNRFTGIIVFNPLTMDNVRQITLLMLEKVKSLANEKNVTLNFAPALIDGLIKKGYDPQWGARPMARVIEDTVETYIADKMLKNEMQPGTVLTLGSEILPS